MPEVAIDAVARSVPGSGMGSPRVLHAETGFAFGRVGPAVVAVFSRQLTSADFETIAEQLRAMPEGFVYMSVMDEDTPAGIDSQARATLVEIFDEFKLGAAAAATAILGGGTRVVAIRTLLTGLVLAARMPVPYRIFATASEAAAYISSQAREPLQAAETEDLVAQLFAAARVPR